jgi:selenocysteine-specific elongation factor
LLTLSPRPFDDTCHAADAPYDKVQFTLVDCPGHASLIRTIIGGAQIIDLMLLVLDINKGIQTQTAEVGVVVVVVVV